MNSSNQHEGDKMVKAELIENPQVPEETGLIAADNVPDVDVAIEQWDAYQKLCKGLLNETDYQEIIVKEKDEDGNTKVLDTSIFERILEGGKILIDPLHKKIQNAVVDLLKKDYNSIQVESGALDSIKQRVDIKGFSKNEQEWHFFEVKTMSAKRSIREALGQILEYAHYPNVELAEKLFIIGPEKPDEKDKAYMKLLRDKYNLPIWFRWYSFSENKLYDGV